MINERMIETLVVRGSDDWVMAADVAWVVRDEVGEAVTEDEVRDQSVMLIAVVLTDGLMRIGDVTDGGFFAWEATLDQALRRVEESWRDLGRAPDLGEVCWLENTADGDDRAAAICGRGS